MGSKIHLHSEQFDGRPHPWCGRGSQAMPDLQFEAADPKLRCKICAREHFPNGQPDYHRNHAIRRLVEIESTSPKETQ